jgi:hypothetical protein
MSPVIRLIGTPYHDSDVKMMVLRVPIAGEFLRHSGILYRVLTVVHHTQDTGAPGFPEVYVTPDQGELRELVGVYSYDP